jgi:hypothetical protein
MEKLANQSHKIYSQNKHWIKSA